ncbi:MAG TPA: GGDEF domain-containing protein, partial [Verrucomicrobiae bacterium]|nr:GGDEF domain-containing protein [Verrucomicrobiae bacterium]
MGTGSTLSLDDVAALIEEPASAEEQCRRFAVPVLEKSGCTRCAILRGQRSSLQIVYAAGRDGPLPLGGTPIADARVFDHLYAGEPLIHLAADPWPADVPFGPEDATLASSGAALLLPLRDESGTGGFVALLGAPRDFEASHIRKLRGLVRVLALALAKPRLHGEFERLSRASTIDALTGLLNRSSFYDRLRAEWRRASRELSPIALALLDVDYFAAYGERYGRPSADRALRAIAHTVADAGLRSSDFVARYGGSALALVMPGSEEEGALALCDRIRRAVAECAIEHSASPYGIVTASVGVASIRPNARRVPASLIFEADSALHRAKQAGRNRVASRDELRTSVAAMPRSLLPAPDTPLDREAELA